MSQGELLPDVDTMFPPYKGFTGTYNPYFRRQKKKKEKIQLLSRKDTRKRPSRIMWIRRKKKKRKSKLTKQKYRHDGFEFEPEYPLPEKYGRMTLREKNEQPINVPWNYDVNADPEKQARDDYQLMRHTDPQVYEGAYRRKHSKKKKAKKQTKKRKGRLMRQRYNYNEEEGYGLGQSAGQVYDSIIAQKKKELKKRGPGKGQISFNDPSVYPEENEENVSYRRKPKVVWLRNKK